MSAYLWHELDDYQVAFSAYENLRDNSAYTGNPDELWAAFFERRALRAEQQQQRDEALMWRLRALPSHPTDNRARAVGELTGEEYIPLASALRHSGPVRAVAFSPDGQHVVTGSDDQMARVWEIVTGAPVGEPLHHQGSISVVAFSPYGRHVVTGSNDETARVWQATTGQPVGEPLRHQGSVWAVAFSPDGQLVMTGSEDGTARVWQAATGQPVGESLRHRRPVRAVAFSPDGTMVLAATQRWLHAARVHSEAIQPTASRLLPGVWIWGGTFFFLEPSANQLRVAVLITVDAICIITLHLDRFTADPVQGEPANLLEHWQKKLGLRLNDAGEIVPLYQ